MSSSLAERASMVRRALELLSVEQREALELAYFEGLTHVEIAERTPRFRREGEAPTLGQMSHRKSPEFQPVESFPSGREVKETQRRRGEFSQGPGVLQRVTFSSAHHPILREIRSGHNQDPRRAQQLHGLKANKTLRVIPSKQTRCP